MDIRPIRSEADHTEALREIDRLWGAPSGSAEGDRLEVLVTLVEAYEERNFPIGPADPVEILDFAITDMGRSREELAELLGSQAGADAILRRERHLTLEQIQAISAGWHLPIALLAVPYRLDRDAA